jgi:hypothetical protein
LTGGFLLGKHEESRNAAFQQGVAVGQQQAQQPGSR